jgi:hypothetical protein
MDVGSNWVSSCGKALAGVENVQVLLHANAAL